jgi:hypothetical protein
MTIPYCGGILDLCQGGTPSLAFALQCASVGHRNKQDKWENGQMGKMKRAKRGNGEKEKL